MTNMFNETKEDEVTLLGANSLSRQEEPTLQSDRPFEDDPAIRESDGLEPGLGITEHECSVRRCPTFDGFCNLVCHGCGGGECHDHSFRYESNIIRQAHLYTPCRTLRKLKLTRLMDKGTCYEVFDIIHDCWRERQQSLSFGLTKLT